MGTGFWEWGDEVVETEVGTTFAETLAAATAEKAGDPYEHILRQVQDGLGGLGLTAARLEHPSKGDEEAVLGLARQMAAQYASMAVSQNLPPLSAEPDEIARQVLNDILGWGPLADCMEDDAVEEIFINGPRDIYVVRAGRPKERVGASFRDAEHLWNFFFHKLDRSGGQRSITTKTPWLDGRLSDGSRFHGIRPPLVANRENLVVTIRRFRPVAKTLDEMVELGSMPARVGRFLEAAVRARCNIVVAGGTASGKCLTADQPVILGDGRIVGIGDLVEKQFASNPVLLERDFSYVQGNGEKVLSWNPDSGGFEASPILAYTRHPAPDRLIRVATSGGREITATEAHPFFVLADGEIRQVQARDLAPGQAVAVPVELPLQVSDELPSLYDFLPQIAQAAPLYVVNQNGTIRSLMEAAKQRLGASSVAALRRKLVADGVEVPKLRSFSEWSHSYAVPLSALLALTRYADVRVEDAFSDGVWLKSRGAKKDLALKWCLRPTEPMMRLFGWILADGYIDRSGVRITQKSPVVQKRIVSLVQESFGIDAKVCDYGYRTPRVEFGSKTLADLMRVVFEVPGRKKARNVEMPQWVLVLPDGMIAALLSGLFDGDAHLSECQLQYSTASASLAWQVHYLLLRLGVDNSLTTREIEGRVHWRVAVYGGSLSRLAEALDLYCPHKAERLASWVDRKARHSNYGVPGLGGALRSARLSAGMTQSEVAECCGLSRRMIGQIEAGERGPTRPILENLAEFLPFGELAEFMRGLVSMPVKWAPITEIEHIDDHAEEYVYDLAVADTHTFVAGKGAIVAHNTTMLNAMGSALDPGERVVSIEDTPELQVPVPDWVQLVTREASEGVEEVSMRDLVRHALRMKPDRIWLGEARGPEMAAILTAANTGHEGVMFTVHADDVRATLTRIQTLVLMAEGAGNLPLWAVRNNIASALHLVVHLSRLRLPDGSEVRRVTGIGEVNDQLQSEQIIVEHLWQWDQRAGDLNWTQNFPSSALNERLQMRSGFDFRKEVAGLSDERSRL